MAIRTSPFEAVSPAPPDPILGLSEAYAADPNPDKVNLGVGAYQDDAGRVPILESVRIAEERWLLKEDTKSYLPQAGVPAYTRAVQKLLFADDPYGAIARSVTLQAPGGTGALRVGAQFLRRSFPGARIFISSPSWENHRGVFESSGFEVGEYPYYRPETHDLDFDGMVAGIETLDPGSIVVLHACCHNPSGVDLSPGQWARLARRFEQLPLIPFIDFAYQGFGDGLHADAEAVRQFTAHGIPCLIATSFSKSLSMYRERVGALTIVAQTPDEAARVGSQVKRDIRTLYSNPPSYGAQVAAIVLEDPELRSRWETELDTMRSRIARMRHGLVAALHGHGVTRNFDFIQHQKGMFSFLGIGPDAIKRLRDEYSIYAVQSSRICVAALNDRNLETVSRAIAEVLS